MHAVDLNNGATFSDIPAPVLERLLEDITGAWKTRGTDAGLLVKVRGADATFGDTDAADPTVVTGALAGVVRWAAGRGADGVEAVRSSVSSIVPAAPKWI
jgi:maleylpyruvate isomerase